MRLNNNQDNFEVFVGASDTKAVLGIWDHNNCGPFSIGIGPILRDLHSEAFVRSTTAVGGSMVLSIPLPKGPSTQIEGIYPKP